LVLTKDKVIVCCYPACQRSGKAGYCFYHSSCVCPEMCMHTYWKTADQKL